MIGINLAYSTDLLIWSAILFSVLAVLVIFNIRYLHKNKIIKQSLDEYVNTVEKQTAEKYNRIVSLPVKEFESYLTTTYSAILELVSVEKVSENDPNSVITLYGLSLTKMYTYLGKETIDAINFYYGEDYLSRWCELRFKILENRGVLTQIVKKTTYADAIASSMKG